MRYQLDMLQSRILELEQSTRLGQPGAAASKLRTPQDGGDISQVLVVKEEKVEHQGPAAQEPGCQKLGTQELDDQESDDHVSEHYKGVEMKPVPTIP